jgi:hypothetical protein
MSSGQKHGESVFKTILFRLFLGFMPGSLLSKFSSKIFESMSTGTHSFSQVIIFNLIISSIILFSLISLFNPKVLIKPLLGAALFWVVCINLKYFTYSGPFHTYVREMIIICAGLACCYLVLYDTLKVCGKIFSFLKSKFAPAPVPSWEGTFNNTLEKGDALEEYVCDLYKKIYGNAMTTGEMKAQGIIPNGPGDQKADVIVMLPNRRKLAIQCKNTKSPIGNDAVEEIMSARAYYHADELAIICPNGFTKRCRELAKAQGDYYRIKIDLIDKSGLEELTLSTERRVA